MALALLAACAGSAAPLQPLADADRQRIASLAIAPEVALPARVEFSDRRTVTASLWEPVAAVFGSASPPDPRARIATDGRARGVMIEDILRAEFRRQIEQAGRFRIGAASPDATVALAVLSYGLTASSGYEDDFVPVLRISATMRDASGRVLWRARGDSAAADAPVAPVPLLSLEREPAQLRKFWESAARAVVAQLLDQL